jgi:hypothetical protein
VSLFSVSALVCAPKPRQSCRGLAAACAVAALALAPAIAHAGPTGGVAPTGPTTPAATTTPAPGGTTTPGATTTPGTTTTPVPSAAGTGPFAGNGMWVWELPHTEGGNLAAIAAKAQKYGMHTLYVKSADGTNVWSQFSPYLVAYFHARGFKVCGWQYVYGANPTGEALAAAAAKTAGADCFAIDAESEYQGRYVSADEYMRGLRARMGKSFPLSLASFPYVDYHESLPYSVFLAPGNAQVNQPQIYWHTIGGGPDANYAHTTIENRVYERPIYPLGQTFDHTPNREIVRFRQLQSAYAAPGVSWWDWQATAASQWSSLSNPLTVPTTPVVPTATYPVLRLKSKGDQVVLAQELLRAAGQPVAVDGVYGSAIRQAVRAVQLDAGLTQTGSIGQLTWPVLLRYTPVAVRWRKVAQKRIVRGHIVTVRVTKAFPAAAPTAAAPARAASARPRAGYTLRTARLPSRREIPVLGRGGSG